jgi:pimeloyl-ACP methyl ester carboxylesterase
MRAPVRISRMALLGCPALILDTAAPFPMRLVALPGIGPMLTSTMVLPSADKARGLPVILGHPADVGKGWSDVDAEAFACYSRLPNFRRSWHTLLNRFVRLTGGNPELKITADQLRQINHPTMFLWGKADNFGPPEVGRQAAALMPNATFDVVGVGHLPWWDAAEECANRVRAFARASVGSAAAGG